jgi:AraC-like DNA-binding protein
MKLNGRSHRSSFDFVTEILETAPLPVKFAGRFHLSAPWGIDLPRNYAVVCCVAHGTFCVTADGDDSVTFAKAGDVLVVSPTGHQRLHDAPDSPTVSARRLLEPHGRGDRTISLCGSGGSLSMLLGGLLEFDNVATWPLQWILPPVLHLRRDEFEDTAPFERIVRLFEQELSPDEPGQQGILNRLVEIMFIRAVQANQVELDAPCEDAIHAMLHPDLATTLVLIHREPEKPWTVSALAERAAMSRSTFSAAFLKVLGRPPLQYLRDYRMQVACRLLNNEALGLKEIASRVGYDSTSAFSTAFKRVTGTHPTGYRHRQMQREALEGGT